MTEIALLDWKYRISRYQTQINASAPAQQRSLFELAQPSADLASIDPFSLMQQNTEKA
ncbi:hypothetical protein [Acaryochloris sp. IP29b_bin.137]|uniref:hypothetical protein n=1 Tax=Acaryochloris sp. IP29b_bin.137 TaxID=2969217 RepID=UPI00263754B3|nr:hypothetical protein [Acaryochloris sp. IP29b_bin.137]